MSTVTTITIETSSLVHTLYPGLRNLLREALPFLDEDFGNVLADKAIRHVVDRSVFHRNENQQPNPFQEQFPRSDALFLARMMVDAGLRTGYVGADSRPVVVDIFETAQGLALEYIRAYENTNGIEITGHTP